MEYAAIHHDMDKRFCYALAPDCFLFRIRTKKGDMRQVVMHYQDKYLPIKFMDTRKETLMEKAASDEYWDYYELTLHFHVVCLRYFFELTDCAGEKIYYGNYEFSRECITDIDKMFDCPQNLREEECFAVPEWAANQVVYQIFPSRFAASRPVDRELWYKAPIAPDDNLHGDLRGIIAHMEHMHELGIDVLYMTPIFRSNSSHKYDTIDYYQIDPSFGTKEDLKELVQKAHSLGMRVVLDGVFNHTAPEFFAFSDIVEKEEKSRYLDWYFVEGFPLVREWGKKPNFKTFSYYGGMPKLNLRNPEVEAYIFDVARYWIRECDIDGWRLDVGDEISHRFWKRFREAVKQEKSDLLIIGEVWHYAGDFLEGDEWDTVMNYHFYLAVMDFVARESITATELLERLSYMRGRIHTRVYPLLWNLIDSHDTARFLHSCGNDKKKQRLGAAFLLLLPGMPMIYYGDEYAMQGGKDPDCRRGMAWDGAHQDGEMFAWYKRLIAVRHASPCLTAGKLMDAAAEDSTGLIRMERQDGREHLLLLFHGKAEPVELKEYEGYDNLLTGAPFTGILEGWDAAVLRV
ncbi:MAG: glycoside hydrolase family 13 protein [Muribaculaceae bacterium]|nr:glycoside hydrolase family 13 protein [Roseburia sp.]MCM1430113.1 glycoside hydrolase family 13 protein [Muribaculaceae bacterium]MCM1492178.1 glycoside hydrolase family 13 protein [Muribaculaceae bacterium]